MSRIGKMPITIPIGVTIEKKEGEVVVKGARGSLTLPIDRRFLVDMKDNQVMVTAPKNSGEVKHLHGLIRSLIANAVIGVVKGWEKSVELIGVGYRAQGGGSEVTLTVGFSHPVKITASKDTLIAITDNTKITISGIDKKEVGETAAMIRAVKPPEPYKGKGIRYRGEVVRKKAGKAVKAVGTTTA